MAVSSQVDRTNFPLERAEEFHRPIQCQLPCCCRQAEERERRVRLPRLYERVHSGNLAW